MGQKKLHGNIFVTLTVFGRSATYLHYILNVRKSMENKYLLHTFIPN